jgi:uncharacterized protein YqjF (DUF2071 family)
MDFADENSSLASRLAMRERPPGPPSLTAKCRQISFLHWSANADRVQRFLPAGLRADTHQGSAYVTLSQFKVRSAKNGKAKWIPSARFNAVTLRTYVIDATGTPGVWLFSIDASSRTLRFLARDILGLPFYHANVHVRHKNNCVAYRARRTRGNNQAECKLTVAIDHSLREAEPGTLEFFLIERYASFSVRAGAVVRSRIYHAPLVLHDGSVESLEESYCTAAGLPELQAEPLFQFCHGIDAEVFPFERVTGRG